ncbi:hypothetical protein FB451DRAFT_1046247 [Mycena latifolia]|nr:hypothetical protein FB451DRAFT_1046247 [Mycena latifolia]
MPGALQALAERPAPGPGKEEEAALAENVPLCLPSALSEELRASGCNKKVVDIETRLRDTQCRSALDQIRNYLHVKSRFRTYKGGNVRHQGTTTRARNLMNRNDAKIRMQAEKYVAAWEAKRALVGEELVGWRRLDPKKDLRCMDSEEDCAQVSKRKMRGKARKRMAGEAATTEDVADGVAEGHDRRTFTRRLWRILRRCGRGYRNWKPWREGNTTRRGRMRIPRMRTSARAPTARRGMMGTTKRGAMITSATRRRRDRWGAARARRRRRRRDPL